MIQGTGGLRKMRFAVPGSQRGRSSGFRVCFVEGLREMAEFATLGEPPEKRYTVRQLTLDIEPGEYTPDKVRTNREVFGLSQPLCAKFRWSRSRHSGTGSRASARPQQSSARSWTS